jgi:hypothetical protein
LEHQRSNRIGQHFVKSTQRLDCLGSHQRGGFSDLSGDTVQGNGVANGNYLNESAIRRTGSGASKPLIQLWFSSRRMKVCRSSRYVHSPQLHRRRGVLVPAYALPTSPDMPSIIATHLLSSLARQIVDDPARLTVHCDLDHVRLVFQAINAGLAFGAGGTIGIARLGNTGQLEQVLSVLGTVKNPVLLTSTLFSSTMMYYSYHLLQDGKLLAGITGAVGFLLSVAVFLSGVAFYVFAFLRLPTTSQELIFLQEGKGTVARSKRAAARPPKRQVTSDG